jgi:DHA1 family multidrug resistance protein-like MFS transporter
MKTSLHALPSDQESDIENPTGTTWKRTLYIMVFAQMMTSVGFSSIFPFLPKYVESLGSVSGLSIELLAGLVFSAQAFTMMLASPVWGTLADRYGRKVMVERAMFSGAVLLFLMAFVRSAEELVLLRTIQGLVTGTVAAANALVAAVAPRERAGYAMGLLQVGLGSGVAFGPMLGGAVADLLGYSFAFYITASLLLLAGVLVLFGVQEKVEQKPATRQKSQGFLSTWKQVLEARGVVTSYVLRFSSQMGRMMITPIMPFLVELLLPGSTQINTYTGLIVGIASASTTLSAGYLGRLGDRIGYRKVLIVSLAIAAVLYGAQSQVTEVWHLMILQAMVGIALGGVLPAISALLAQFTRPGQEGAVYGLDNSINSAGRAVAPMIGASVSLWFGLRATFLATGAVFIITCILANVLLPSKTVDENSEVE